MKASTGICIRGTCAAMVATCLAAPAFGQTPFPVHERTSTLDWLLTERTASADLGALALWRSDDGRFELSLREGGTLLLKPVKPQPGFLSTQPEGGVSLVMQAPGFYPLRVGLSAGIDGAADVSCLGPLAGWPCLGPTGFDVLGLTLEQQGRGTLAAGVGGEDWQVDLSYVSYWVPDQAQAMLLAPSASPAGRWLLAGSTPGQPGLQDPWRGQQLGLSGRFGAHGSDGWTLGVSVAQWRRSPGPWSQGEEFDTGAFSFGLSRGALSGELVSRIVHSEPLGQSHHYWAGLDLGLAWRMPWHAELRFGARNLVTRTQQATPTPPAAMDEARARTPYVRYRQDF
ncbi:MAG TPA: hypothetical protein PKZ76_08035 [Xanthomonadaceae bacterium]|nr:hypothetical protein [Xanthomonadaceae bacterium]